MFWRTQAWFERKLARIVARYCLTDKADIHTSDNVGQVTCTLHRIVEREEDSDFPLPRPFVEEVKKLVRKFYGKRAKFQLGLGLTFRQIREAQLRWQFHCQLFRLCED